MPELESKMSVIESMKQEKISSDELQQFYDSLSNNLQTKCDFTIGKHTLDKKGYFIKKTFIFFIFFDSQRLGIL